MIQSNPKLRWWEELAWQLYGRLPAVAEDALKRCSSYILPFKNLRIPIAILRGPTRLAGRSGTVIVAGAEYWINYLTCYFFESEPQRKLMGKVPLWSLAQTLKRLRASADLTVTRVDLFSARLLFNADYLAVPGVVSSLLALPEDLAKLVQSSHNLKEDLRIVRRNNLSPEVTHAEADFEVFYHTMHVPFVRKRHGEQAIVRDFYQLRRRFHQGGLIWVLRNGQRVSGVLFQRRGQVLLSLAVGMDNWEQGPRRTGAIVATYFFMINHAKELGCKFIDFGGCRPFLNDGVLQYKRKWGINLIDHYNNYYDLLVHWNRLNGPVTSFLLNTPLIFRDHGGFSAIYVIDRDEPATQTEAWKVYNSMWIPGLQRLYLIATSGWQPVHYSPPQTTLIDLTEVGDCNPRVLQALGSK